ncbi:MAG: hypothetical protein CVV23_05405 [Ignavibacteriae bacterium HGW-Ignavibacteriae-2]|jgi:hypothetical protein|nr:MAG: hypothetical protein CVV23_05405 [Ignavibacteriae bacterium HGW-Ignavibacteriae-2]
MQIKIDPQLIVPEYPKIPEDCHIIENENSIHIYGLEESLVFSGENSLSLLKTLLPILDGKNSTTNILKNYEGNEKEHIVMILKYLYYKGLFEKYDEIVDKDGTDNNNGNLKYYSRCVDITRNSANRYEVIDKITTYPLLVIGNSELSTEILNELKGAGFKNIELIMIENEDLANILNNKISISNIMESSAIKPNLHVLCALDRSIPLLFQKINEFTYKEKLNLTVSCLLEKSFIIGPTFIPDETGCYFCYEQRIHANTVDLDSLLIRNSFLNQTSTGPFAHTNYNKNLYISMLVAEIVNLATFINYPQTVDNEMEYNFIYTKLAKTRYYRSPSCKLCSKNVNSSRFIFSGEKQ